VGSLRGFARVVVCAGTNAQVRVCACVGVGACVGVHVCVWGGGGCECGYKCGCVCGCGCGCGCGCVREWVSLFCLCVSVFQVYGVRPDLGSW